MKTPNTRENKTIGDLFRDHTAIDRAAQEAVRQAILRHKLLGQSIVTWENGQCVWIAPEDIQVPPAPDAKEASDPVRHAG